MGDEPFSSGNVLGFDILTPIGETQALRLAVQTAGAVHCAGGTAQAAPDQTAGEVQTGGTHVVPAESGTKGAVQEIDAVVNVEFTASDFPSVSFTVATKL